MQLDSQILSDLRPAKALVVLVADGDAGVRADLREKLESMGHSVIDVACGNDGIRVLKRETVNVVVTEVIMANGDGLELILELKRIQPAARVIAMSAGGRYLPAADCLRVAKGLGAHETIMKPVERPQLAAALDRLVSDELVVRR